MRIPVVPQLSTKDGLTNKNARLTNVLKETKKTGELAVVRPGLSLDAVASGVGNGLVVFNDELVSVYGATLGIATTSVGGEYGDWVVFPGVIGGGAYSGAYGDGVFMVAGASSFAVSSDSFDWELKSTPAASGLYFLGSDGTRFYAINAATGISYVSSNKGDSWTQGDTFNFDLPLSGCVFCFDGTYLFALMEGDNGGPALYRTQDGSLWDDVLPGAIDYFDDVPNSIASDGSGRVLVGVVTASTLDSHVYISTDHGGNWTDYPPPTYPTSLTYGNGVFVLRDGTASYTSPNGQFFSLGSSDIGVSVGGQSFTTFDGSNFVATNYSSGSANYAYSDDGVSWTLKTNTPGAFVYLNVIGGNGVTIGFSGEDELRGINLIRTTITTLDTVSNNLFDFAQSPL